MDILQGTLGKGNNTKVNPSFSLYKGCQEPLQGT